MASTAQQIGKDRTQWKALKTACKNAGAPANLFSGKNLGPALEKAYDLVYRIHHGEKSAQEAKGETALLKVRKEVRDLAANIESTARTYKEKARKEADKWDTSKKTTPTGLRDALRNAINFLEATETSYDELKRII